MPVIKPEERVQHITIPGRAGELTVTEGDDIYQSYIQTVPIVINGMENVQDVESWLTGDGEVTFSSQPLLKQRARVIGAVTLDKHSRNLGWWEGDVQFYCDPIKHLVTENQITLSTSGSTVTNPGDMTAFPKIAITGSGIVTIKAGGKTLTIPECVNGWVVDSENGWILQSGVPKMNACSGEFPVLNPGDNTVTFTGATALTITPNWRYL